MDSGSNGHRYGSEGNHNNNSNNNNGGGDERKRPNEESMKGKTYHRHTPQQIRQMEALFRECPHPDDKQRMQLSRELGLKPHQVKFWFQNRRTQYKAQADRGENLMLRAENEALKGDNLRLQAAMQNVVCPRCNSPAILGEMSFDEQQLRIDNVRLKEELQRLTSLLGLLEISRQPQSLDSESPQLPLSLDLDMGSYSRHLGSSSGMGRTDDLLPVPHNPSQDTTALVAAPTVELDKSLLFDLAMTAADHLFKMCHTNEPLWFRRSGSSKDILDLVEHSRMFTWPVELKQHGEMRTEASRAGALFMVNSMALVDSFFDAEKWIELFPSVVAKAETVQVISSGISAHGNGRLHLMRAELQFPSPLIPSRQVHFFRYCQQNSDDHMWIIVDFPVDGFQNVVHPPSFLSWCRRRTSGCVIQDLLNGYSKVLWVEHAEVEDKPLHPTFNQFVRSGGAFGATRWVSTLQRQCEREASLASNIPGFGVIQSAETRRNLVKLSQRMLRAFSANIISSETQTWTALSNSSDDTIRVTTRTSREPGQLNGLILTAVSTACLPFAHQQVFDLLTDGNMWSQLDIILSGSSLHEVGNVANGSHPKNCVSLLRDNNETLNSSTNAELILLQESSTHPTGGSFVLYATVDTNAMYAAISGQDPSYVPLLPGGFVIMPAGSPNGHVGTSAAGAVPSDSCLLTIAVQVLASSSPSAVLDMSTVTAVSNHVGKTMQQIITMLGCSARTEPPAYSRS